MQFCYPGRPQISSFSLTLQMYNIFIAVYEYGHRFFRIFFSLFVCLAGFRPSYQRKAKKWARIQPLLDRFVPRKE